MLCRGERCRIRSDVKRGPPDRMKLQSFRWPDRGVWISPSVEQPSEAAAVIVGPCGRSVDRLHTEIVPYIDAGAGRE